MGDYTFAELKDMLKLELEERDIFEDFGDLGNLFGRWVNAAYLSLTTRNRLWELKINYHWPELEFVDTTKSTSDGIPYVSTPDNTLFVRHVYDKTNNVKLDNISLGEYVGYTDRSSASSEGPPNEWHRSQDRIYLHPTPGSTLSLEIWGRKKPTALSAADDVTLIGNEWDEAILKLAVAQSLSRLRDDDGSKAAKAEFVEIIIGLIGVYGEETKDRTSETYIDPIYLASKKGR